MAEFHLHASLLSVEKGNSASAGYNYIYRLGEHAHRAHELIFCSSGNMPVWAKDDPGLYWASADLYERSNGRLARQIDFAIPIELADQDRINLATAFARALAMSPDGLLPYSYSVHYDDPEHPHNPHCHVLISQRINDGHPRSAETWFRRAAVKSKAPETGGARKTSFDNSEPKAREWLIGIRTKWADMANDALKEAGFEVRIDERSYKAQGVNRIPQIHLGAAVCGMAKRGIYTGHWRHNESIKRRNKRIEEIEEQINVFEQEIAFLAGEMEQSKAEIDEIEAEEAIDIPAPIIEPVEVPAPPAPRQEPKRIRLR